MYLPSQFHLFFCVWVHVVVHSTWSVVFCSILAHGSRGHYQSGNNVDGRNEPPSVLLYLIFATVRQSCLLRSAHTTQFPLSLLVCIFYVVWSLLGMSGPTSTDVSARTDQIEMDETRTFTTFEIMTGKQKCPGDITSGRCREVSVPGQQFPRFYFCKNWLTPHDLLTRQRQPLVRTDVRQFFFFFMAGVYFFLEKTGKKTFSLWDQAHSEAAEAQYMPTVHTSDMHSQTRHDRQTVSRFRLLEGNSSRDARGV